MQIAKHKVVTIDYVLTDEEGKVIDRSDSGEFAYLHGAQNVITGLETALDGKSAGDELNVSVPPEEAYGVRDDNKTQVVPLDMFPADASLSVGDQFHAQGPNGESLMVTVAAVEGDNVTVDGNHPLAGAQLNFDVKVVEVREASQEEIDHGHVHGPDGHHH